MFYFLQNLSKEEDKFLCILLFLWIRIRGTEQILLIIPK